MRISRIFIVFTIFFIAGIVSGGDKVHAQTLCNQITNAAQVVQGFSSPLEVALGTNQLIVNVTCNTNDTVTVQAGNGSQFQYVYELGYRWAGTGWQQFTMTGTQKTGPWVLGNAQATVAATPNEFINGGYIVAYICTWTGSVWKCGCLDQACATPNWQLQVFKNTGGGGSTSGSTSGGSTSGGSSGGSNEVIRPMQGDLEELITDLDTPWDMAFLPDGTMIVTERKGTVVHIAKDGTRTVTDISPVVEDSESGLLGVALHPNFAQNKYLYIYYKHTNGPNRVERYTLASTNKLSQQVLILDNIPSKRNHSGGRLRFGPDGHLYIATGDASNASNSQNRNSLGGKILRVTDEGDPVSGNPFNNEVYSMGHRNPQGLAWDSAGRLWATEHGPSGSQGSGCDELNLIEPGNNYGWPDSRCSSNNGGHTAPRHQTTSGTTWAPSGVAYWNDRLIVAGLRGSRLYEANLNGTSVGNIEEHFENTYGRLRGVSLGPDGMIYISTSNRDGRGRPTTGDDKIIRINPSAYF